MRPARRASEQRRIASPKDSRATLLAVLLLGGAILMQGCAYRVKPFIRIEPTLNKGPFFPESTLRSPQATDESDQLILDHVRSLVGQQLLAEASALCDQYLACHPDTAIGCRLRLKCLKIRFMQNVLEGGMKNREIPWILTTEDWRSRVYLRHKGYSAVLDRFLIQEGFQPADETPIDFKASDGSVDLAALDSLLSSGLKSLSSFPSQAEFDYLTALIDETRVVLDQIEIPENQEDGIKERDLFSDFLNGFEQEVVLLRFWDIVWVGDWDKAVQYADEPPRTGEVLRKDFSLLKEKVEEREKFQRRSANAGGLLSGVIPGLGSAYGHRWARGAAWFLGEAVLAGGAAYFFQQSGWEDDTDIALGSSFAVVGLIVHVFNIGDGAENVEDFNERQKRREIKAFFQEAFPTSSNRAGWSPYPGP